jgi:hypothetical protein
MALFKKLLQWCRESLKKMSPKQNCKNLVVSERLPVGVRIRDAILVFNVLLSEEHLEPNCHFAFLNVP